MSLEQPFNVAPASERLERGIPARARWGYGSILGGIGIGLLLFLTAAGATAPVVSHYGTDSPKALAAGAVATAAWDLALAGMVLWLASRKGGTSRDLGLRGPWRGEGWSLPRLALWVGGAYIAAWVVLIAYGTVIKIFGLDFLEPGKQVPDAVFDHGWLLVLLGISVVGTAPFAEELFFRGFVFGGLRRHWPLPLAALASGLLFSLAHLDPGLIIPFTLIGAVFAYTYERTGSLFADMSVHFVFNLVSFLLLVATHGGGS